MNESEIDVAELERENRRLRAALETLIDQMEASNDVVTDPSQGGVDLAAVRDAMPLAPGESNPIAPPWEREGYESKDAWMADRE